MPAQLVHIKYAIAYLEKRPGINRTEFLRGTSFPDIRRMAGIDRNRTHRWKITLDDVAASKNDWYAGLLLHSYLDVSWSMYFRNIGIPAGAYEDKIWAAVKLAEEAQWCGRMEGRTEAVEALSGPMLPQEERFGVSPDTLERWYEFIIWKLQTPFKLEAWRDHAAEIHWEAAKMERLLDRVETIRRDEEWQERLAGLAKEMGYGD